jgi:RNA polymerase-binding transcription factor DksA
MNKKDLQYFKEKLLAEKAEVEAELGGVGRKSSTGNNGTWDATTTDIEVDSADENEVADKLEEYEGNVGIINSLEKQLIDINSALERIDAGTYGKCEVCGKDIEKNRLEANPSARTSIKHDHK